MHRNQWKTYQYHSLDINSVKINQKQHAYLFFFFFSSPEGFLEWHRNCTRNRILSNFCVLLNGGILFCSAALDWKSITSSIFNWYFFKTEGKVKDKRVESWHGTRQLRAETCCSLPSERCNIYFLLVFISVFTEPSLNYYLTFSTG